jgi:hypothetical protein
MWSDYVVDHLEAQLHHSKDSPDPHEGNWRMHLAAASFNGLLPHNNFPLDGSIAPSCVSLQPSDNTMHVQLYVTHTQTPIPT